MVEHRGIRPENLTSQEWRQVLAIPAGGVGFVSGYLWVCPPGMPIAEPMPEGAKCWPSAAGYTVDRVIQYHQAGQRWVGWLRAGTWTRADYT